MDLVSVVLSCLVQSLVILFFVFLLWSGHVLLTALRKKKRTGFGVWSGLVSTRRSFAELVGVAVVAVVVGAGLSTFAYLWVPGQAGFVASEHSPAVKYAAFGSPLWIGIAVLAYGYLGTGFWEELFFRGVIAKRLISWFGFWPGNFAQGLIFAGLHHGMLLLVLPGAALGLHGFTFVWTMTASLASLWYNEKRAAGSIVGSWLIHGGVNVGTVVANLVLLSHTGGGQ